LLHAEKPFRNRYRAFCRAAFFIKFLKIVPASIIGGSVYTIAKANVNESKHEPPQSRRGLLRNVI